MRPVLPLIRRFLAPLVVIAACFILAIPASSRDRHRSMPALTWRPIEVGYGCEASITTDQSREGTGALRLQTLSSANDKDAWFSFVRIEVKRKDGKPLGLLKQLVNGGALSADFFRDPASGNGMPAYTLPWAALRVQNPDGEEAVLLWESAFNGWAPNKNAAVPVGEWLDDVRLDTGTFWMRYQGRNYNSGKGFQSLSAYASGIPAINRNTTSLKLCADTRVVAVEFGSGPNLPGLLVAYVDDMRISFAGGISYRYSFEPETQVKKE